MGGKSHAKARAGKAKASPAPPATPALSAAARKTPAPKRGRPPKLTMGNRKEPTARTLSFEAEGTQKGDELRKLQVLPGSKLLVQLNLSLLGGNELHFTDLGVATVGFVGERQIYSARHLNNRLATRGYPSCIVGEGVGCAVLASAVDDARKDIDAAASECGIQVKADIRQDPEIAASFFSQKSKIAVSILQATLADKEQAQTAEQQRSRQWTPLENSATFVRGLFAENLESSSSQQLSAVALRLHYASPLLTDEKALRGFRLCAALESRVLRFVPLDVGTLLRLKAQMNYADFTGTTAAREGMAEMLSVVLLPGLANGRIADASEAPFPLIPHEQQCLRRGSHVGPRTEDELVEYWRDVHMIDIPRGFSYVKVVVAGAILLTYPSCCVFKAVVDVPAAALATGHEGLQAFVDHLRAVDGMEVANVGADGGVAAGGNGGGAAGSSSGGGQLKHPAFKSAASVLASKRSRSEQIGSSSGGAAASDNNLVDSFLEQLAIEGSDEGLVLAWASPPPPSVQLAAGAAASTPADEVEGRGDKCGSSDEMALEADDATEDAENPAAGARAHDVSEMVATAVAAKTDENAASGAAASAPRTPSAVKRTPRGKAAPKTNKKQQLPTESSDGSTTAAAATPTTFNRAKSTPTVLPTAPVAPAAAQANATGSAAAASASAGAKRRLKAAASAGTSEASVPAAAAASLGTPSAGAAAPKLKSATKRAAAPAQKAPRTPAAKKDAPKAKASGAASITKSKSSAKTAAVRAPRSSSKSSSSSGSSQKTGDAARKATPQETTGAAAAAAPSGPTLTNKVSSVALTGEGKFGVRWERDAAGNVYIAAKEEPTLCSRQVPVGAVLVSVGATAVANKSLEEVEALLAGPRPLRLKFTFPAEVEDVAAGKNKKCAAQKQKENVGGSAAGAPAAKRQRTG